jgi:transcriptional regulator with PAS, ATPase and Fis domain
VACELSLLQDAALSISVWSALSKRSVVLLDSRGRPSDAALALLRLRQRNVRAVCTIVQRTSSKGVHVSSAAESRIAFGRRPAPPDPRVTQMLAEADRLLVRGRHSAAERALRSLTGALERRGDPTRAGAAGIALGRLLLARGRAADAKAVFEDAHIAFQRGHAPERAIDATIYVGLTQTDLTAFGEAEQSCRIAYAAADALHRDESILFAGIALARNLLWQERYADARSILESITPAGDASHCARYWCLVARLHIVANAFPEASRAIERARPLACGMSAELESVVRLCEATVQARVGDLEALRLHVAAGLVAARAAHLPLQAIKLKLVHVEGLINAQRSGAARVTAKRLDSIRRSAVPPLLRSRVESVLKGLEKTPSVRESMPRFQIADSAGGVAELDRLRDLLALTHQLEDEAEALTRVATAIRMHTHAAGVGIFGLHGVTARLAGGSGPSSESSAQRAINSGQPIVPHQGTNWMDAAVPVQYFGRIIGAMSLRWNIEGPESIERALAFAAAAAAVCAPLVYVLVERQSARPRDEDSFDLVGVSQAIADVRKAIARAASAPFTVLIEGESGSGKELVARAIHRAGCRRDRRFCALNCAAMPEDLIDAELFGHAKGAFTGAAGERLGLFESADGGTVFLDEVGELSARAQAKVLRVLQEGEVRRIGEHFTRPFDARLVAATNRPLRGEVEAKRFRQDLLYRLDVIRIPVPPLRDRVEDIPLLAARFWKQSAERIGSKAVLGQNALSALARYDWPGNVRELQNVLTALVVAAPTRGVVGASHLPAAVARAAQAAHESLESARLKFEERFVRAALARAAGHRGQTAAALGLSRQGLAKLMQRLHLDA